MVEGLGERYREATVTLVRHSLIIDAPPEDVWHVIGIPQNLPRWNPHIRAVHDAPDGELQEGDGYTVELRVMGVPLHVRAEVVELQRNRYSEVLLSGPLEATIRTYLRPIGTHQTRLEHEVHYGFRGGPLGVLVARGVRLLGASTILRRGTRAQKEQVEAG